MSEFIKRDLYLEQIRPFIGTDVIKVLTGMRRTGKSVMLDLIKSDIMASGVPEDRFIRMDFEDKSNASLCNADALHEYVDGRLEGKKGRHYLLFDEIQEVSSWETCINSLRATKNVDIFLTGSNSRLLSGELATYLSGRYVSFTVYPFSFAEFVNAKTRHLADYKPEESNIREHFNGYLTTGGMPFVVSLGLSGQAATHYLRDLYDSVILKDVVARNNIRSVDQLQRIIDFAFANIGKTFSATSVSKYFVNEKRSISTETVINYMRYCADAFLLYKAQREDLIGRRVLTVSEKYYCVDHALREAVGVPGNRNIAQTLENIVYLELLRRGYEVTVGKTHDLEVDFVARRADERHYLQVSYLLSSPETIAREVRPFASIADHYPKHIISLDEVDLSSNGVRHHYLPQFLLAQTWGDA
ncbi:MAG: ATP-binding protein [Coriobacteriales bacterium]|jgi:predicted AAA+ superfamily ATPase|nr:ATP-binding protein [Coriobacteriales bacterium]